MKCPKCDHVFKDEGRSAGGRKSKRKISPEAQAKMQAGKKKPKADIEQKDG